MPVFPVGGGVDSVAKLEATVPALAVVAVFVAEAAGEGTD
jgi:hypothetical protein